MILGSSYKVVIFYDNFMINWELNDNVGLPKTSKGDIGSYKNFFNNIVNTSFDILKIKDANLSIAIVSDEEIQTANKEYRRKDKVTDVLSFVYDTDPLDGEILICCNKILEQSKEKKHSFDEELKILLVHSLVHLAGYDHKKDEEERGMKKIEKNILDRL